MASPARGRLRRSAGRLAAGLVAVAIIGGMSAGAWAVTRSPALALRTAIASKGDVEQTLTVTGTVEALRRAALTFGTSGTVASVAVTAGQQVKAGQTLATLDTTALTIAITKAKAGVATAAAKLAADKTAQTDQVAAVAATAAAKVAATAKAAASAKAAAVSAAAAAVVSSQQQAAVTAAQRGADSALVTAATALANGTTLCAAPEATPTAGPSPTTSPSPTGGRPPTGLPAALPSTSPTPAPTTGPGGSKPGGTPSGQAAKATTCGTALDDVAQALQQAATAQAELQKAITATSGGGAQSGRGEVSTGQSGSTTTNQDASASAVSSSTAGTATGGTGGIARAITDSDLADDQAAQVRARAALVAAEQNLKAGRLTSPFAGTVADVSIAIGGSVTRSTAVATIVSRAAATVTVAIPESDIRAIEVGQAATLIPDGSTVPIVSAVSAIGFVPSAASTSVAYPVTVDASEAATRLALGARVAVSITTRMVTGVVTVPTSAVHRVAGTAATVTTVVGGKTASTPVTVGAVSAERTEIRTGLELGATVLVADPNQPLPSNTTNRGLQGGPGGPPGGGGTTVRQPGGARTG